MSIAFVDVATTSTTMSDSGGDAVVTVNLPSCSDGDLLVVSCGMSAGILGGLYAPFPRDLAFTDPGSSGQDMTFYRICDGTEPSSTVFYLPGDGGTFSGYPVVAAACVYSSPDTSAPDYPTLPVGTWGDSGTDIVSAFDNPGHTSATVTYPWDSSPSAPYSYADVGSFFYAAALAYLSGASATGFSDATQRASLSRTDVAPDLNTYQVLLVVADVLEADTHVTPGGQPQPTPSCQFSTPGVPSALPLYGTALLNYHHLFLSTDCSLTSDANPAATGTLVSFTFTITTGDMTPTGSVEFFDGGSSLGTNSLFEDSPGAASTEFSVDSLTAGGHVISAVYSGTDTFQEATCVLSEAIEVPPSGANGYWGILAE